MSTKTSFKRIALVAVAALGFGTLSVVPSSAGQELSNVSIVSSSTTGTTLVAVSATVNFNFVASGDKIAIAGAAIYAAPATSSLSTLGGSLQWAALSDTSTAVNNSGALTYQNYDAGSWNGYTWGLQSTATANGRSSANYKLTFTPDKAGSYMVRIFAAPHQDKSANFVDWFVTVTDPVQKSATAFIDTNLSAESTANASSLVFTSTASTTAKARLTVKQYSTTDTATATTAAISKDVVVAISKGLVSKTNDYAAAAASVTTAAATASTNDYYVFANGTTGSASLTVTVGGVLVSTKTITFNGVAVVLSAALTSGQKTWIAPTQTTTVTVTAKDSAGNAASNTPTITAISGNTAVATASVSGLVVTITGVAAGTSVITIADAATSAPASSTTYTVTVTAATTSATLPTISFDKSEYNPGELMTITVRADAADNASFAAFTANPTISVSVITVSNPFTTGAVALVSGKATWTAYAPLTPGPVVITATSGTGSSATSAAVSATALVLTDGVAQAALDAAAEALDAANAATDAANAATDAADAATAAAQDAADAVAALAVTTQAQIASMRLQNIALSKKIIALTALVNKLLKK